MPNTKELVRRIQSVKGTQQITKAMKMVAAAKLRRAQETITHARPWANTLAHVLANVAARTEFSHPLLEEHEGDKSWVVIISSDKGLCGSFNSNLVRTLEKKLISGQWPANAELAVVGRKASDFFRSRKWNLVIDERTVMTSPSPDDGPRLGRQFMEAFTSGAVDEVWLVYNSFVNMIRQDVKIERLLPIEPPKVESEEDDSQVDYLYEPDARTLLAELLPRHVETQVQKALYDSAAAEQAARMTSMDIATRNADDMIDALTMLYNRTRQAAITKELIEIVSGAQALEG
ncbi:MAG: ATP synthase F1 subunit gamma [Thermoanaerobaculales bacterium]|nr:ATP synthase F1 subunit gamma [Thermoanaerobaculales bacterium]